MTRSRIELPLFDPPQDPGRESLGEGAFLLRGFAAQRVPALLDAVQNIERESPFRHMTTRGGFRMSVAMTNCGALGWITDRSGYRYGDLDPETGASWPAMPAVFHELATEAAHAAGYPGFAPDACLINRYEPGTSLSLHQDRNERNFEAPIVSVSLGLSATFLFGGLERTTRPRRVEVRHGDVTVWGGPSRLVFHGVAKLKEGAHPVTGRRRINLTLRKAG